ncbi:MAG: trypsin-like serine protease [SAR202 cluster bacterium]|nr:trypsin-like serine protease [SAR202 cluster bacterium]MDP6302107.1 trypsin-like serine protease [SAR202 cluster bacterium]MDP7104881.1 trypsin-like serine protease [SAR202 cluster bacterium]MDP7413829.1 trypsin-like serine protease [SAR202 cluster bacterium]HJO83839.1 trypsin-like serine protease [SAR202 cluster bacterium]
MVGGQAAAPGEWPWQVALVVNNTSPFAGRFCGGSLIAADWVVTAGHCVTDGNSALLATSIYYVQSGITTLSTNSGIASSIATWSSIRVSITLRSTTTSPCCNSRLRSRSEARSVRSCLLSPATASLAAPGATTTVLGWGALSEGGSLADVPQEVEVPVVSNAVCNAPEILNGTVTANMLCAGVLDSGGLDACQGDSGGSLVVPDGQGGWRLAGIVSWGNGCARPQRPGVYTRVSQFSGFITANAEVFGGDVSVTKTASPNPVAPGGNLTYTIVVTNGSASSTSVVLTDVMPQGVTATSASSTLGACNTGTTTVCNLGALSANASSTVTIETTITSSTTGVISNQVTVAASSTDPASSNNTATATTTVQSTEAVPGVTAWGMLALVLALGAILARRLAPRGE